MFQKLIFVIPLLTLALFFLNVFWKGNTVQSCLLFVLSMLPLMDLKVTPEAWGGFKTFDFICFYALVFLFKEFTTVNLRQGNDFYLFLFIILAIIMLLGGLASEFPEKTYLQLVKALPVFIFGRFFITEIYKDPDFRAKAINALKVSYLIALTFLFIQIVVGLKFTFYPGLAPNTLDPVFKIIRYPGVFYDSQAHGQFLAMGSFLFLYLEEGTTMRIRVLNYLVFVLSIAAIVLAGSRAAFGGFAVGMVIVFFMAAKNYRIYGSILAILAVSAYMLISPQSGVFDRAKNLSEDYLFRQSIWQEAFEISKQHPYLGIGSGNYQKYVMRHAQNQYLEVEDGELVYFDQPENGYLKIMVELGFIGFAAFMLFILVPLLKGMVNYFKGTFDSRVTYFMASLIAWVIAFNTVYSIYDNRLLIMVASMSVALITYPAKAYYKKEHRSYELAVN